MPLQIKELYIKVTVSENQEEGVPEGSTSGPEKSNAQSMDKSQIIADCVEQVMEILKEKMEP